MLLDKTVRELITAFSSADPTPGGGSASALASAVGASLLMMVGGLVKTRTGAVAEKAALAAATRTLTGIRDQLTEAIDADAAAYDRVVSAYKLPKGSAEQQQARTAAVHRALREATDVPLGVMRLSAGALDEAKTIALCGHKGAAGDVGVALALLRAGLRGARLNVEINLGGIDDATYSETMRSDAERYSRQAAVAADVAERSLA